MLDRIRSMLAEDHTLSVDEAVNHYVAEREEAIETAQERAADIREDVVAAMDDLEEALQHLREYEDEEDLAVVEDVAENVSRDRLRMIDGFDAPEDPESLHDAVETFVDDFQTMTQKESAVLDRIGDPARAVFDRLKALRKANDRLASHTTDGHETVRTRERLETLVDRYASVQEDIDALDTELDDLDTAAIRDEIAALEEELDALEDDPRNDRKRELEEAIAALEEERDTIRSRVARAARKMERGLKKLVYEARNGDVTLSRETITVLEDIVDGRVADEFTDPAADIGRAVEAARSALPDDLISDRQRERLEEGAETLTDLDSLRDDMEELTAKIGEKREALEEIAIDEEREDLEIRLEQARDRLKNRSGRREELRAKREKKQEELAAIRDEVEDMLNEALPGDHTVTG